MFLREDGLGSIVGRCGWPAATGHVQVATGSPAVSDGRAEAFLGAAWRRRFDLTGFGPGGSPLGRSAAEADRGRGQGSPGGQILWKIERRRLEAKRNAVIPRDHLRPAQPI